MSNNSKIIIKSEGYLQINGGKILNANIKALEGGKLMILNNGSLKIRDGGKFKINKGATFKIKSGKIK